MCARMNTFRNRLTIALAGFLVLCAAVVVLSVLRATELRSAVRVQASAHAQIEAYFELHTKLREFYSDYGRVVEDAGAASTLDFGAYRRQIDELLLSIQAQIERGNIELGGYDQTGGPGGDGVTPERAGLLSLSSEIQSMLAGSEIAAALFRAGRQAEGLDVLREAVDDESVGHKLGTIIDAAVAADKAQAREIETALLARFQAVISRTYMFAGVFVVFAVMVILWIFAPFARSMAFLQGQIDKLALGGDVDPAKPGECLEFAAMHEGLSRIAAAHARLRDQWDQCETELNERTDAMRQVDQVRRDLLADVSHELRTPLTVIRGVAEVALRTQSSDPEELKTTMTRIVEESRHVTRIVDDLFLIARLTAGTLDLRTDIVDLTTVSKAAAEEAETIAERVGGRLLWRHPSKPVEVEGDTNRLRQLFTILVDNAFKYGGRKPVVEVDHILDGNSVTINIRDHGPGIKEEDLPHVFERLYRGSGPANADGSGLGLPLAQSIVQGHSGQISLENAEGGGALARVSLPLFDVNTLEDTAS